MDETATKPDHTNHGIVAVVADAVRGCATPSRIISIGTVACAVND
jgi:hypothetical protein